ncbi:unnamed protein product [Ilex paraguariensis]|uniref:Remorin C-terminal domain-containing protein n=1 Tax=Ilex paraguariensis TaxID=185542 RepID=A0ABC8T746_9AQUA
MGEEEPNKVESELSSVATAHLKSKEEPAEEKTPNHEPDEKAFVPISEKEFSPSKPPPIHENAAFAKVEQEKKMALIKAWEDNEKIRADSKAYKKVCAIGEWENTKRASVEAQLVQIEEKFEKKKAEYAEKMKNKMAGIHKAAAEKRVMIEAKRGEDILKVGETAAKFRATGNIPMKLFGCFRG